LKLKFLFENYSIGEKLSIQKEKGLHDFPGAATIK
jgi:hypothetical protein